MRRLLLALLALIAWVPGLGAQELRTKDMPILLEEHWTAGAGLFNGISHFDRATDGTDPSYPYINEAEEIQVSGGLLTLRAGSWANAGLWGGTTKYTDFHANTTSYTAGSAWADTPVYEKTTGVNNRGYYYDGTRGYFEVSYTVSTASLAAAAYAPILALHSSPANVGLPLQVNYDHGPGELYLEYWQKGLSNGYETISYPLVAGQTYVFRAEWQCGTVGATWADVSADGFVRLYVNDVLVHDASNVKFFTENVFAGPMVNKIGGFYIGFYGLLGDVNYFILANDEYSAVTTPVALPVATPATPQTDCSPQTQVSNGGKGNAGCNTGGVGWTRSYFGPWGTGPQHAEPAAGETLTGKLGVELWAEFVHTDYPSGTKTTYRQAMVPLADPATYQGGYKKDGLLSVGAIEHAIGNEQGGIEATTVDLEYTGALDRQFHALLADQELEGDEIRIKAASDAARAAGTAPRVLMRAVVTRARLQSTLRASIQAVDQLFAPGGPFGPGTMYPGRTYADLGRGAPQMTADTKATPIVPPYGEQSDAGARDPITNEVNPKGKVPGVYLGMFAVDGLPTPEPSTGFASYAELRAAMQVSKDANTLADDWPQIGVLDAAKLQAADSLPDTYAAFEVEVGVDDAAACMATGTTAAPTSNEWGILAFGFGPVHSWLGVFGSDLGGGVAENKHDRTELDFMARAGSDLLVPGDGVCPWTAFEITNPDTGETFGLAAIGVRGPLLEDHLNGVVNITANLIGLEHVGDGSGDPVGLGFDAWHHALENFILAGKTAGPWVTTSTAKKWDDGTPMVDAAAFQTLQARSAASLGGDGLYAGWYQDRPVPTTEMMALLGTWTDSRPGFDRHGRFTVFGVDEEADTSAWTRINHVTDIFGPVEITFGEERQTICEGVCDWDPDASKFRVARIQETSGSGYTRYKNRHKPGALMENGLLTDEDQLRWVLQRRLARLQHGTTLITVIGPEGWLDLDVGDGVLLTTEEGPGASGYVDRACIILRSWYDVASRLVRLTLWDVENVLIATRFENGLARIPSVTDDAGGFVVTDDADLTPLVLT